MNWTKASAIAEILSSAAIVVTLIYMLVEISQNTAALETSARQTTVQNDLAILLSAVEDPEIWLNQHKQELTEAESEQLSAYLFAVTRIQEHNWLQFLSGALDETTWVSYQSGFVGTLSQPQTRKWWDYYSGQGVWAPGFEDFVNERLENTPVATVNTDVEAFR